MRPRPRPRFFAFAAAFAAAAAGLFLGACESAPRPFQHLAPPAAGELSAPGREAAGVEVILKGGAKPAAEAMARLTAEALLARGVPAAPAPAPGQGQGQGQRQGGAFEGQGWTFEGLVTRAPADSAFTAVRIHWTLRERARRWAGAHAQDVPGAAAGWERAAPAMLAQAAEHAAAAAADLLRAGEAGPGREAAEWGVWIAPVTGPDDADSRALARALGPALRLALGALGAPVRESESGAAAVIAGRAEVSPAPPEKGGGADVLIVWEVFGAGGQSAGTAEQQNTVPPPGPPGGWGETAALAAAAAADALAGLLRRTTR